MTANQTTEYDDFLGIVCLLSWYITAFCKATHKKHNAIDVLREIGNKSSSNTVKRINGNNIYVGRSVGRLAGRLFNMRLIHGGVNEIKCN